jgi:hypothetical protein
MLCEKLLNKYLEYTCITYDLHYINCEVMLIKIMKNKRDKFKNYSYFTKYLLCL